MKSVLHNRETDHQTMPIASNVDLYSMKTFAELKLPKSDDENELLKHRFLCRGGGVLLLGQSGIGKSSFIAQIAMCWSLGKPAFGIEPARPLKILVIQAENDDGDMAEMRDGVQAGMIKSALFAKDEDVLATQSVHTLRVTTATGEKVGELLMKYAPGFDLVILDPLFAYIGGDVMQARDVSRFLREIINPVVEKLNIGIIIVHHNNKPSRDKNNHEWTAGDLAYLGAGSAELTNWARAVIAIRSIGSDSIYELCAPKRGKRLGWQDAEGHRTQNKLIGHSETGICWHELSAEEATKYRPADTATKKDRPPLHEQIKLATAITLKKAWKKSELKSEITRTLSISPSCYDRQILPAIRESDGVTQATTHKGKTPVHLIGTPDAIEKERKRLENEYKESLQKHLSIGE